MSNTPDGNLQLAMDHAHALRLLHASHELYQEIVGTLRDTVAENGRIDADQMAKRVNQALTSFAPRDHEIARLIEKA